jgi:hypothetical protein
LFSTPNFPERVFFHIFYATNSGVAAGEVIESARPVSQRLTALQAAEPQDSDPEFFHTFYATTAA